MSKFCGIFLLIGLLFFLFLQVDLDLRNETLENYSQCCNTRISRYHVYDECQIGRQILWVHDFFNPN